MPKRSVQNQPTSQAVQLTRVRESRWLYSLLPLYLLVVGIYLPWRTTIANWHIWYGPIVYLAELYGIVTTIMFLLIAWRIDQPVFRASTRRSNVDVFICTYNEPVSVLGPVILGATKIRGIQNVYVLDDGNRPEVAAQAKKYGAHYHARGTNQHAKAGNLNAGLALSDAEFVITLDADHVPLPEFLDRTLGYFDDPGLAFVQTPQTYYNTETFLFRRRRDGRVWSEQGMFYGTIQPSKNRWNSAFFVGTSAILRRAAIDSVGGFATGTATEDIHTSLRLHAAGWKSIFVSEVLAYGLEAQNLKEYHKQRRRWAAGSLGLLLRSPDSPLRARGLSLGQRINYLSATLAHLQGVQKIVFFCLPIVTVLSLRGPVMLNVGTFTIYLVAYSLVAIGVTASYARGTYHWLYNEAYGLSQVPAHWSGLRGVIKVQKKFAVSRKNATRRERTWLKPFFWLMLVLVTAAAIRSIILINHHQHLSLAIASAAFISINVLTLGTFLIILYRYEHGPQSPSLEGATTEEFYQSVIQLAAKSAR